MSVTNVKVVARHLSHSPSRDERDRNFTSLFRTFKREVAKAGVLKEYKKHENYESRGQKRRRKQRESLIAVLKAKLRESFVEGGNGKPRKEREFE